MDWVLLLVGPMTTALSGATLNRLVSESRGRVQLAGPVYGEELWDYYRGAELLLLLSEKENFGMVLAEALACATPVAVSRGVDLWAQIQRHGCGFTVPDIAHSEERYREAFGASPHALLEMGRRGREWVREEFDFDRFADRLAEICEAAVSTR